MSERFNDYLSNNSTKEPKLIAKADATFVSRPLLSMSIRPDLSLDLRIYER